MCIGRKKDASLVYKKPSQSYQASVPNQTVCVRPHQPKLEEGMTPVQQLHVPIRTVSKYIIIHVHCKRIQT